MSAVDAAIENGVDLDGSPIPPKIKQTPSPTEIKMCKDKKDDPIECERSGDCIFEFKGKNGQEYKASDKASDPGVVEYYRKTFKGALLSSTINHYDNMVVVVDKDKEPQPAKDFMSQIREKGF